MIPVARTGIGNIALSAVQFEPELFRCMAFKGAEIICRVATGGFEYEDMRLTSYHNSLGAAPEDIDYVFCTHLHFDHPHCGRVESNASGFRFVFAP